MLKSLSVQNYALISNLNIEFQKGLSTITGETGAGKSILIGAMSLLLGQRADSTLLLDKEKKCIVEALFDIQNFNLKAFFDDLDIDYDNNTVLRREISPNGKSRAFINDTPVNITDLRLISLKLIDIHSQHQNLELSNNIFQLNIVDSYANQLNLVKEYRAEFKTYNQLQSQYITLIEKAEKQRSDCDYYQFQHSQLEEAKLNENEQVELEQEMEILTHAGEIKSTLLYTSQALSGEGVSILNSLKDILSANLKIKNFYPDIEEIIQRLDSSYIELKDICREIDIISEKIEHNPSRLDLINKRLDLIYSLQQKHHVNTISGLILVKNELENKLNEISSFDSQIENLNKAINGQLIKIKNIAKSISEKRKVVLPEIESRIINILQQLGMPNAKFSIRQVFNEELSINGIDDILFLFSANKHAEMQELSKVASGGEISRLMLSLKTLLTEKSMLPTIIFDEIDSGVSGEIADKMGNIINNLAAGMQVINITHLPQIASKGKQHYLVYKMDKENKTTTHIKLLTENERINEIAKMLSGEQLTNAAVLNAKELLSN